MEIAASMVLMLVCAVGTLLALVGLPGTWLMAAGAMAINWWWIPGFVSPWAIGVVLLLAVLGEIFEIAAGAVGAKKAGGSKRAALGALIGGLAGALFGTVLIPIPVIGTIIGSAIGAGLGALSMELTLRADPDGAPRPRGHSTRVGAGAFKARLIASALKGGCGVLAWIVLVVSLLVDGF